MLHKKLQKYAIYAGCLSICRLSKIFTNKTFWPEKFIREGAKFTGTGTGQSVGGGGRDFFGKKLMGLGLFQKKIEGVETFQKKKSTGLGVFLKKKIDRAKTFSIVKTGGSRLFQKVKWGRGF